MKKRILLSVVYHSLPRRNMRCVYKKLINRGTRFFFSVRQKRFSTARVILPKIERISCLMTKRFRHFKCVFLHSHDKDCVFSRAHIEALKKRNLRSGGQIK